MTNKEQHIENLKKLKSFHNGSYGVSVNTAIKALEQQSNTVPKSVYMQVARERDIAIEQLNELGYEFGEKIEQQKTGHWINIGLEGEIDEQIVRAFSCSECGAISIFRIGYKELINSDLCPNCGARMESEEE